MVTIFTTLSSKYHKSCTYTRRRECAEEERYSRRVSLKEIAENDYNLNITRYVSLAQEEPPIDLAANHAKLSAIDNDIETARVKLNVFLRELGLDEI